MLLTRYNVGCTKRIGLFHPDRSKTANRWRRRSHSRGCRSTEAKKQVNIHPTQLTQIKILFNLMNIVLHHQQIYLKIFKMLFNEWKAEAVILINLRCSRVTMFYGLMAHIVSQAKLFWDNACHMVSYHVYLSYIRSKALLQL